MVDCTLQFIGTATTLLRLGPFTVLTDPNFLHQGERAHLGYGLTSRRLREPALSVDELPPLDAVVLSHLHDDHWDRVAEAHLDRALPVITTPSAATTLRRRGFGNASGLATWQDHRLERDDAELTVTSMPGRHARGPLRFLLPQVMGSVLELRVGGVLVTRLYVTGDTLLVDELASVPARYPELDAAVLHLGGTRLPGGVKVTMDGEDGAELMSRLRARTHVPVHVDDYTVFTSPLSDFRQAVSARGLEGAVTWVDRGETVPLPRVDDSTA